MTQHYEITSTPPRYCDDINIRESTADFRISIFYVNDTGRDVHVLHRNNLPITVNSINHGNFRGGDFIIRTVYHFFSKKAIDSVLLKTARCDGRYAAPGKELTMIGDVLRGKNVSGNVTVTLDRAINLKSLESGVILYQQESDIMVSLDANMSSFPHPCSPEGDSYMKMNMQSVENAVSGVFIEMIDNENQIGDRYMYSGKRVIKIPVQTNHAKPSGVYYTISENNGISTTAEHAFCSFEAAKDLLGLHPTREEAMTNGNPDSIVKSEEERHKRLMLDLKTKGDREKAEQESRLSELRSKAMEMQASLEAAKTANMHLKDELETARLARADKFDEKKTYRSDHYEERSYDRKDTHEIIKYVPAVIAGAIGAFALMKANSSSN